jgi:hypothetical protein
MVKKVAQAAAGELYETLMTDNRMFEAWKQSNPGLTPKQLETRFIAKNWQHCLEFARATLVALLKTELDSARAETIMEALVLDASLRRGRQAGLRQIGQQVAVR